MKTINHESFGPQIHFSNHIFPKHGEDWGWRTLPDTELLLVLAGTFEFALPNKPPIEINPGHILFIYPDEPHCFRHTAGNPELSCIHCDLFPESGAPSAFRLLNPKPQRITRLRPDDPVKECFLRCAETFAGHSSLREKILNTGLREIWLRLSEYWGSSAGQPSISARMQHMLDFLHQHLAKPVGRSDLAREFNLTSEHINYLFKKELGVSPGEFITRERIRCAFFLLQEKEISVKEAADIVGFSDAFHFSKTFKRLYGIPPSRVRKFMRATLR